MPAKDPVPVLHGTVLDSRGQPVADAVIAVTRAPADIPDIAALTGPDGAFSFGVPQPGRYQIAVHARGHPGMSATVQVGTTAGTECVLRLEG